METQPVTKPSKGSIALRVVIAGAVLWWFFIVNRYGKGLF